MALHTGIKFKNSMLILAIEDGLEKNGQHK